MGGSRLGVDFDATSLWVETPTSALRFERNARIVNPEMRCLARRNVACQTVFSGFWCPVGFSSLGQCSHVCAG